MWESAVFCLMVYLIIASVGDVISTKTKGVVGSILFCCIVYAAAFLSGLFPRTALANTGILAVNDNFMMFSVMCGLGAQIKPKEFLAEWKTVLISLAGCVGVIVVFLTVGRLILDHNYAVAAIGPVCGGLMASLAVAAKANELNLPVIAAFGTTVMVWQSFVGIPFCNFMLKRHVDAQLKSGFLDKATATALEKATLPPSKKLLPAIPDKYNTKTVMFCKLIIVVFLGQQLSALTGITITVCELVLGILFTSIGWLDEKILPKSDLMTFFMFGAAFSCPANYANLELDQLLAIIAPVAISLILGAVTLTIVSGFFGKLVLKYDFWLSAAIGLCALFGFPITVVLPEDIVKSYALPEKESALLLDYIQPKMLISGFTSVSIASVIIAGFMAELLVL